MISVRELPDVVVIDLGPRLTLENASELLRVVETMSSGVAQSLIVNLSRTKVIDSSGVGALVNSLKYIKQKSGTFALAELPQEILHMFHMMNLHQVFDIFESEAVAQRQLTARRA